MDVARTSADAVHGDVAQVRLALILPKGVDFGIEFPRVSIHDDDGSMRGGQRYDGVDFVRVEFGIGKESLGDESSDRVAEHELLVGTQCETKRV